ncbi:MAG: NADH-quinone oxidoreductase subunit J [Coriobacteriia bacterium]
MTLQILALVLAGLLVTGGALVVAFTTDVMRLVLGLGTFLLGVAGLFLYFGLPFLATAQVFVYVGGVLVLVVFAVMVVHRHHGEKPIIEVKHDLGSAAVAFGVSTMIVTSLRGVVPDVWPASGTAGTGLSAELLGPKVLAFELAGALLLVGLVAVLAIRGGEDQS